MTAVLTDSDGGVSGASWQWGKSSTRAGPLYEHQRRHVSFLHAARGRRRQVPDGGGWATLTGSGPARPPMPCRPTPSNNPNRPPAFPDQDPNTNGIQTAQTRTVNENTAAGANIGAPVAATDQDGGDVLTYSLGGTDGRFLCHRGVVGAVADRSAPGLRD